MLVIATTAMVIKAIEDGFSQPRTDDVAIDADLDNRRLSNATPARSPTARTRPPACAALQRTLGVSPRTIVLRSEIEMAIVWRNI